MHSDTITYMVAGATTGSFAAASWFVTFSETMRTASACIAVVVGCITIYKFITEFKNKKNQKQ